MADLQIQFTMGNFPEGYCFSGVQSYANDLVALLTGIVPGGAGLVISANVPAPGDQNKLWVRLNSDGTMEGIYIFLGVWLRPHPSPPNVNAVPLIWKGTEPDLWAYDGGDGTDPSANPPTDTTGAMYMRDTDFGADDGSIPFRVPIGSGKNSVTYDGNPATQINVGDTGGEERHKLVVGELASHTHDFVVNHETGQGGAGYKRDNDATQGSPALTTVATGGDLSHQNLPPYRGVIFARRTVRKFITV